MTTIRVKVLPKFPADVVGASGIAVSRVGLTYTFSLDQSVIPVVTGPTVVVVGATLTSSDVLVQTNQSGSITLVVPSSVVWAAQNSRFGVPLTIMDISGNASANNVTINFTGGQTASGLSSLVISSNYGVFRLTPKSGGGWVVS